MNSKENSSGTVMPSVVERLWMIQSKIGPSHPHYAQSRLYRALFCDIAQLFPNFVCDDFSYLLSRIEMEGHRFYLETLPQLGKAFEVSLVTCEDFKIPAGWKVMHDTRLPKFMFDLFSQVMHDDGSIKEAFSISSEKQTLVRAQSVQLIRQVCLMWSKAELVGPLAKSKHHLLLQKRKERDALESFAKRVQTPFLLPSRANDFVHDAFCEASWLLEKVFAEDNASGSLLSIREFGKRPWGRHGPGAVAGKEVGFEKWCFSTWPGLPSQLFEWRPGCVAAPQPVKKVTSQPVARVCAVPKDFRGPRVICIEPKENQFAQQGLMDLLYRHLSRHPLTRRSINFFDVEESRAMCYDSTYATIDLKDASDLLSLRLCRLLLPRWFYKLATRYRTRQVSVMGKTITTTCFATMGSALCFPVQTMIFWALALGTMSVLRKSMPLRYHKTMKMGLRVFGDDIIVPLWAADGVCSVLEACGLRVNPQKTCIFSPVRESCGEWVYDRKSVRIFKFRTTDVVDLRSHFGWRDLLRDLKQTNLSAFQVEVNEYLTSLAPAPKRRWNRLLQRFECLSPTVVQRGRRVELSDYVGLYAQHVRNDRTPFLKGDRKMVKMRWRVEE